MTDPVLTARAHLFDGLSSRPRPVRVSVQDGLLVLRPDAGGAGSPEPSSVPLEQVRWPERVRHGARIARLPGGASLQALDTAEWDAWMQQQVRQDSLVVRAQQSWRGVMLALVVLVGALAAGYIWGLPVLTRGVVALVPASVDEILGEQTLRSLDGRLLQESALPAADQQRIRASFSSAAKLAHGDKAGAWRLEFRKGKPDGNGKALLGPNAFALPGGTLVLTDELVNLVKDDDVLMGVLGHELGHARQRHGMRQVVQVSALGAIASIAFGDYGTFLSTAPVLIASMGYSRDAEREADEESIRLMKAARISPLVMVKFFEALKAGREKDGKAPGGAADGLGIAFSTHPADNERIARFRQAAAR